MCVSNNIGHCIQANTSIVMGVIPDGASVGLSVVIIRSSLSPSPASVTAPTEMRYSVPGVSWVKVKLV